MEIIFVVAAATGRTLVLPPKEPLYRLRVSATLHTLLGIAIVQLIYFRKTGRHKEPTPWLRRFFPSPH